MKLENIIREPLPSSELQVLMYAPRLGLLGLCYRHGNGVDCDLVKAFQLFRESAQAGRLMGKFQFALCYLKGAGIDKN